METSRLVSYAMNIGEDQGQETREPTSFEADGGKKDFRLAAWHPFLDQNA